MKLLLDRKEVDPDSRDHYNRTPLFYATEGRYEGIVKLLLDRKEVNPDSRSNNGQTPLLRAAERGHEGIVKLLLDRKEVNPDSRDNDGETPLLCAAHSRHEGIMKLLLDRKEVNPDSRGRNGRTPLCWAAGGGNEEIVKLLLDRKEVNPGSRGDDGLTPLSHAAWSRHEGIMKLLLGRKEVGPNSEDLRRLVFLLSFRGGNEGIVRLLQGCADPESCIGANDTSMSPFHLLENSSEGLAVSQLSLSPPGVAPDILTQNTNAAHSSAASHKTPNTSSEIFSQVPPPDFPPLVLPHSVPRTAIAAAGIAAVIAILAITIRWWL